LKTFITFNNRGGANEVRVSNDADRLTWVVG